VRVLMLGWEFPPFISGGLGTACEGLTRALARRDVEVLFVLPKAVGPEGAGLDDEKRGRKHRERYATTMVLKAIPATLTSPYQMVGAPGHTVLVETGPVWARRGGESGVPAEAESATPSAARLRLGEARLRAVNRVRVVGTGAASGYEGDLVGRIRDYAERCLRVTQDEPFDLVHAHDWVTFPAGMAIAARSGKPLVVQVHSTEFDRSGEQVNQPVYDIERAGMHAAQAIIAVSNLTKKIIVERYAVPPEKVRVVHNGIDPDPPPAAPRTANGEKTVLFLGRITMQKGPEYFVSAAARVLERMNNVQFIIAGWGDRGPAIIEQVAALGLGARVRFAGFLRGEDVERAYRMADVYVMPSVSEPFGLTALEAIRHGVPVILSKNSGAAEVLHRGALKVDFWDVEQMAEKIIALLRFPQLVDAVRQTGAAEIRALTWDEAARQCIGLYREQTSALGN